MLSAFLLAAVVWLPIIGLLVAAAYHECRKATEREG